MIRGSRALRAGALAISIAALTAGAAQAQPINTSLTVSGFPLTVAAPNGGDFSSGSILSSPVTFDVDASGGPPGQTRTATVSIRCEMPCPTSGSKAVTGLHWQRGGGGPWTTLTTSDVLVEQRSMVRNGLNDPWGNTITFRFLLDWLTDPPGTAGSFDVIVTLTVTAP